MKIIKKSLQLFFYMVIRVIVFGGVAQLVRASACHAEGREFEPRRSRHLEEESFQRLFFYSVPGSLTESIPSLTSMLEVFEKFSKNLNSI